MGVEGYRATTEGAGKNLACLNRLDAARTTELRDELNAVKQHLPKKSRGDGSTAAPAGVSILKNTPPQSNFAYPPIFV
jgi:hypothetical protein